MTERRVYDRALLEEVLARDGATLVGEYEKLYADISIQLKCKCGAEGKRIFKYCIKYGSVCENCAKRNRINKQGFIKYDTNLLHKILERDSAKLLDSNTLPNLNRDLNIKFICSCGKNGEREFRKMYELGCYCAKCAVNNRIQKYENTVNKTYGVKNISQLEEIKEQKVNTLVKNYGVTNPLLSDSIKDKIKKTNIEKYGTDIPSKSLVVKEKIKNTHLRDETKQQMINTNLKRYGVEYATQSQEIQEKQQKNSKKYKEYKMPSGQIRKVQGYEPFALDALLKTYTEEQIMTDRKDVPHISYEVNGKKRVYFPDIFIPHVNTIVEVKSTWTYKCKADNVNLKKKATEEKGYVYELWCFDSKGNRVLV